MEPNEKNKARLASYYEGLGITTFLVKQATQLLEGVLDAACPEPPDKDADCMEPYLRQEYLLHEFYEVVKLLEKDTWYAAEAKAAEVIKLCDSMTAERRKEMLHKEIADLRQRLGRRS